MVIGSAGTGKSTLMQHIAYVSNLPQYDPLRCKWLSAYDHVIWLPLRCIVDSWQLTDSNAPDIAQFIYHCYDGQRNGLGRLSAECNRKLSQLTILLSSHSAERRILFLLDGYDEVANIALETGMSPEQVRTRKLLEKLRTWSSRILTARPYATPPNSSDYEVKVIGFDDKDVQRFICKYFERDQDRPADEYAGKLQSLKRFVRYQDQRSIPCSHQPLYDLLRVGHARA